MNSKTVHPSSCDWIHPQLSAYIDGEVSPRSAEQSSAHLERCGRGRRTHRRQVLEVTETIRELGNIPTLNRWGNLPDLTQSVMASLPSTAPSAVKRVRRRPWDGLRPAAALLLGLCLWALLAPAPDLSNPGILALRSTPIQLLRGDIDANGRFELSDLRSLVGYLQEDTSVELACLAAADFDDDGIITLGDSVIAARAFTGNSSSEGAAVTFVTFGDDSSLPCEGMCP